MGMLVVEVHTLRMHMQKDLKLSAEEYWRLIYESASQFANKTNLCTDRGLVAVLKSNTTPITRYRALVSPLFKEEDIGKTPKELGYEYITDVEIMKPENNNG